jgi:hypothetical protein
MISQTRAIGSPNVNFRSTSADRHAMSPASTFVDHFPCDPSAAMFEAHEKIDEELRNCDALWPNATMGTLFPGCSKASAGERQVLFAAAMERVEWHCGDQPQTGGNWLVYLTCMLRMVSRNATGIDDATLLRLATYGPRLHGRGGGAAHFHDLPGLVAKALAKRKASPAPELARALESLVDHLVRMHDHSPDTFEIAFRLFRAGWSSVSWISIELNSPEWSKLLDLSDHNWQTSGALSAKSAPRLASALAKIGDERLTALINQTVEAMKACQPTPMSGAGMTILRQMLRWVQVMPQLPVDEALYRLSGIRWDASVTETGLMKEWLGTFLQTVALRDRDRAFACVECLANNPDTKVFREVSRMYDQYMQELLLDVPAPHREGADGFPIQSEWHRIIDNFLRASAPSPMLPGETAVQSAFSARSTHLDLVLRQSNAGYPALLRAMHERVDWLAKHEPPAPQGGRVQMPWLAWRCDLGRLYCGILDRKPELEGADLAALCRVDALGWLGIAPTGPVFSACEAWIAKNGFDPELTAAMQEWQKSVFGGGTAMALRKHIAWLLWFDTAAPINEKACWSAVIRKDLRGMPAAVRGPWIALLGNVCLGLSEKPTKKWLKPAETLLRNVGPEEFQARFRAWFRPFQSGSALKITVAGRDILGSLLWYSQLTKDPKVDEAVRWFATAKWKAKVDRDRTARLLPIWIHTMTVRESEPAPTQALDAIHAYKAAGQLELNGTSLELYQELCRRCERTPEIAPPPPAPPVDTEAVIAKVMQKSMHRQLGEAVQFAGDSMVVSNKVTGERYEIGLRDGRMVRLSDGKTVRLEIDWTQSPFRHLKSMIDGGDLANPFGRNYSRAMLCARILAGAIPVNVPIVVDESETV